MNSVYEIVEKAKKTGKIEKGTNEVTKAIERGVAKFVAYAEDVQPKEIVQHLPVLCREKGIPCMAVDSKQKLGNVAGITVATASVAVIDAGDAASKIAEFAKDIKPRQEAKEAEKKIETPEKIEEKPKKKEISSKKKAEVKKEKQA
jgi:large subunit ribosomal protein L7Ae